MRNLEGKCFNLANRNFAIKTNTVCTVWPSSRLISAGFAHIGSVSLTLAQFRSHWLSFARIGSVSLTLAPYRSHWLSFRTAQRGLVCLLFLYLYSINSAICRPSDRTAGRPRAEIRTRDGRETLTTKYDCISFNHPNTVWSVSGPAPAARVENSLFRSFDSFALSLLRSSRSFKKSDETESL